MTRSRKQEGLGLWFWPGLSPHLAPCLPRVPGHPWAARSGELALRYTAHRWCAAQPGPAPPQGTLCAEGFLKRSPFRSLSSLFGVNMNKRQLSEWGSFVYPVDARQTMNLLLPRWHRLLSKQINRAGATETGPNTQSYGDSMVITVPPVTIWTHKPILYLDNKTSPMSPTLALYRDTN